MARVNNLSNFLTDVASAIKTKKGSETNIPAANFDTEILALPSQGTYEQRVLNVSANGTQTITPSSGFDAIDELELTVAVPEKQLQSKTYNFTQNTTIQLLPDTGYDGFDVVTLNINVPSGSGDIKLFETEQAMQEDPDASEGDLAVVYREELTGVTEESEFDSCTFSNTVVLDEAFTDNVYGRFMAIGDGWFDGMIEISSSGFNFDGSGESGEIRVEYTSSDGITYTRTDGGEESIEFGTTIKYEPMGPWNDVIGNFMKIGGSYFDGLYQYSKVRDIYAVNSLDLSENITKIYIPSELLDYVSDDLPDFKDRYTDANEILIVSDLVQNNNIIRGTAYLGYGITPAIISNHLYIAKSYRSSYSSTDVAFQKIEFDTSASNIILSNTLITYSTLSQNTQLGTNLSGGTGHTYYSCIPNDPILTDVTIANYGQLVYNTNMDRPLYYIKCDSIGLDGSHTQAQENIIYDKLTYVFAPTQLTLSSSNQLLADIIGYGKNGIVTGDGTVLDNFTLYEFINSNIGEPYDIKTLHNSKIIYKNGSNNYNKTLLKHKTFDGTGICMFEKLNPLENAIGSPNAFVKYKYGYVLIKIDSTNSIFTFVYYDSNFNYRHTQTVNVSKKIYVDGRAVNWYEDDTGLYCLLSPPSTTTDIGMLHILDTTATIKLSTKTGTYRFNWGIVTSDHYGISVSGTYSSSKYTLYINKYNYSANTVTNITTLSNISLSNTRTSFAEDADNVYVCIGNSSYTASSTYQNCKVYVISKSTYTVSKTIDTGSKYAVFTSASDTAPCLVIIDSNGKATVNLMVNGNLEYQHDIARPTIEFYYWSKYMSNKQSLYITGGGYSFGYVSICTPTENNIVLPNIEWWSDTGNTYNSSLFSSAQPYDITENTIDVYTFTSTADFYHIHVDLTLDFTNTNEGEFMLPISDKTKSYMAYAYFGYIFDNKYDTNLVLDNLDAGGAEQYLGGTPITDITNVGGFDVFNANGDSILYYVMKTVTATSNMTGFSMNNIRVLDNGVIQWIPYGNNTVFNTDDYLEYTITCTDAYNNTKTKTIMIYNSEKEKEPDDPGPDDPGELE